MGASGKLDVAGASEESIEGTESSQLGISSPLVGGMENIRAAPPTLANTDKTMVML